MLDQTVNLLLALMTLVMLVGMITALYWMISYIIDDIHDRRITRYQERGNKNEEG